MMFAIGDSAVVAYLWHWFSTHAIWILMGAALALAMLVYGGPRLRDRMAPAEIGSRRPGLRRVCDAVIATLDTIILTVIAVAAIAITLSREGPEALITPESIQVWFVSHGLLILVIAAIGYLVYHLVRSVIPGIVESSMSARGRGRKAREDLARRAQTLGGALSTIAGVTILTIASFMILGEVGVDVTPLLATAGVAGIAIGLGAQSLIRDVIAGLFILMEDQYNKGDVVKVAGIAGLVEDVTLKRTVLRDLDGIVHSIPNGEIKTASNYTKEYSRMNLDVPVAYGENLERVIAVINRVGQELAKDPLWGPKIRSAPQSLGVNKFGDSGVEIKVLGDTNPMMQWEVTREFRLRIKKAFDQEHIEIPFPHLRLYYGQTDSGSSLRCPVCQQPQVDGGKYCSNCGASLSGDAGPAQPQSESK